MRLLGANLRSGLVGVLRVGEHLDLRWGDVDLEGGSATVARSSQEAGCQLIVSPPKTARLRPAVGLIHTVERPARIMGKDCGWAQVWRTSSPTFSAAHGDGADATAS